MSNVRRRKTPDMSFDSDFIGEVSASTPQTKASVSPSRKKSVTFEDEDDFIGDLAMLSPERSVTFDEDKEVEECTDNGEMSDPDEAMYWYAESGGLDVNQSPMKSNNTESVRGETEEDLYEVPEIGAAKKTQGINNDTQQSRGSVTKESTQEVKFFHFLAFMMLRHMLGFAWEFDPFKIMFNNTKLLTNGSNSEKKEFRKMMTLRRLQFREHRCEVVPQLKRDT